jgi:hypothetical protein
MLSNGPRKFFPWESSAEYNSYKASFPKTPGFELILIGAEMYQDRDQHDRLMLHFKGKPYSDGTVVASGDPVEFTYSTNNIKQTFYGYVYSIEPINEADAQNTNILCVSASYLLKNTDQKIYKNVTADQVVTKIAAKYGMKAVTQRHPRVRKTIVQAGQSDWQLLRRLANQTGFALRVENTTIIFVSKNKIYANKKSQAPYFNYVDKELGGATTRLERAMGSVISFDPIVSDESPELGSRVDRIVTGYNEKTGTVIETKHTLKDFSFEDKGVVVTEETSAEFKAWEALQ